MFCEYMICRKANLCCCVQHEFWPMLCFTININSIHITMAKYSEKASEKVEETMHEMKEGKLKSGSGKKVTSKKQAIAIGLSEARKEGAKVPKKKD